MGNHKRILLLVIIIMIISACSWGSQKAATTLLQPSTNLSATPLNLTVQVQNVTDVFDTVGQTVNYTFAITNNGETALPGPALVNDPKIVITCPDLRTIGNQNESLETNETIICPHAYALTQADLDAGTVTVNAVASVGGVTSNTGVATILTNKTATLLLDISATPARFNRIGQKITFTYLIKNSTQETLPAPFSIEDNLEAVVNCTQPENGQLAPNQEMACTAEYVVIQADMDAGSLISRATATGGGKTSNRASVKVNRNNDLSQDAVSPVSGTTIQHTIVEGEWIIQLARCYGADSDEILSNNPQITDTRNIKPGTIITITNIGSEGIVYGPPCVVFHQVLANESWSSIAAQYNADVAVLQEANPGDLAVGRTLKVPRNSAGGN